MKSKYWITGLVLLIAAAGWGGRFAWRVRQQRVTLDVREMPLRQVLTEIQWQTRKKIRAEQALDARITLHVTNRPLRDVLDRIAEQAGARWSTLYAVYTSAGARRSLERALTGDGKLEPAGWTQLAPKERDLGPLDPEGGPRVFRRAIPGAGPADGLEGGPRPAPPGQPGPGGIMTFRHGPEAGFMVTRNGNGQTEVWSPEELLAETSLTNRIAADPAQEPTAQAAEQAARKVNGEWTTYLAFRKSIMGVGFAGPGLGRPGTNPLKHDANDQFARLTPQQRVQRARQRQTFQMVRQEVGAFEKRHDEK